MNKQFAQAIDLMIEDLHTKHHEIRSKAKELGCDPDLEKVKNLLIEYLNSLKSFNNIKND